MNYDFCYRLGRDSRLDPLPAYLPAADYRLFFGFSNRTAIWVVAELHLMFAAFVLGVPIHPAIFAGYFIST
ncbi:MAG: hypothetical protein Q8O31_04390 [Rhodocyclaceae bacterium]|nr:hypothetical protein [Rhodocyclaceae bacterium]